MDTKDYPPAPAATANRAQTEAAPTLVGLFEPSALLQSNTEIINRLGKVGLDANRPAICGRCLLQLPGAHKRITKLVVCMRPSRIDRDASFERRGSFREFSICLERFAEIVMCYSEIGPDADGLP